MKRLMLGTAAGVVALSGAQAADLPRASKAVEYVRACTLHGAGFYYIPGTDTCLRIGGAFRVDTAFNGSTFDAPFWLGGPNGAGSYNRNYFSTRERFNLFVDTRTATDYGVVRTFASLIFDFAQGRESIAGGAIENDLIFIQFAGFTFGKAVSMFDPQWTLAKPTITSGLLGGSNNASGIPMLAYTASFGNGFSATVSLEEAQPYRSAGVVNATNGFLGPFGSNIAANGLQSGFYGSAANTFIGNTQGGDHAPDIVGNLRLDQAWGSLHVGAAAHEVHGTYYTPSDSASGHPNATWGYAVTGAFELKNLPTGVGDSLKVEATFANGAAKYVFGGTYDIVGAGRFAIADGNTIGFGYVLDGVYTGLSAAGGSGIMKSTAWDVSAYYEHYWTPAWRTSLFGSYSSISYGSANAALLAAANGGGFLSNTSVSPAVLTGSFNGTNTGSFNFSIAQIGTRTAWTPVKDLMLAAEFIYTWLDQNQGGVYTSAGSIPGVVTGTVMKPRDQTRKNVGVAIVRSF